MLLKYVLKIWRNKKKRDKRNMKPNLISYIIIGAIIGLLIVGTIFYGLSKVPSSPIKVYEICLENECYVVQDYRASTFNNCVSFYEEEKFIAFCGNVKIKEV